MSWKLPYRSEVWKLKFAACLIPEWLCSVEQHSFPALQLPAPSGKWLYSCLSDEGVQEELRERSLFLSSSGCGAEQSPLPCVLRDLLLSLHCQWVRPAVLPQSCSSFLPAH